MMREWLESHGLGRYTTLFEENEVDFEILRALTENDLADLGLGFGPRRKLVNALIKMKAAPSLAADATGPGRSTQSDASVGGAGSIADGERREQLALGDTPNLAAHLKGTYKGKRNKIEHRLFSYISLNSRGQPLVSHEIIVNPIAATTTRKGLKVRAAIEEAKYAKGIKVTDAEFAALQIARDDFHGEWNYVISPNK